MSAKLSDQRRSDLTALSFILFLVGTFSYTAKEGVGITIGWPSLALAALPWLPWFSTFLFENFRKVKVGGVELEIASAVRKLALKGFALGVTQSDFPVAKQIRLLPKISVAEYQLAFALANASETVTREQKKQISILATKVADFYVWRCLAAGPDQQTPPAFAGREVELEKSAHYYRLAIQFRRVSWRPWNGLGSVLAVRHEWSAARAHFERATRYNPKRATPWYNLGLTCDQERSSRTMTALELEQSRLVEAGHYRRALECNDQLWNAWYNLSFVLAELRQDRPSIDGLVAAYKVDGPRTRDELQNPSDQALFRALLDRTDDEPLRTALNAILGLGPSR